MRSLSFTSFPTARAVLAVSAVLTLTLTAPSGAKPRNSFGRIAALPKGARVERAGKALKGVKAGTTLQEGDLVQGGSAGNLDVFLGSLGTYRLRPKSRLKILKVAPARPAAGAKVDVRTQLESGSSLIRIRELGEQSRFELGTAGAVTAAKGTAFRVRWNPAAKVSSILVAEGVVAVNLRSAPERLLLVRAREKVLAGATLPETATAAEAADEPEIAELLKLTLPPAAPGPNAAQPGAGAARLGAWRTAKGQPLRLALFAGTRVSALQRAVGATVSRPGERAGSINNLFDLSQRGLPEVTVYYSPKTLRIRWIRVWLRGKFAELTREERLRMVGIEPDSVGTEAEALGFGPSGNVIPVKGIAKGWGVSGVDSDSLDITTTDVFDIE